MDTHGSNSDRNLFLAACAAALLTCACGDDEHAAASAEQERSVSAADGGATKQSSTAGSQVDGSVEPDAPLVSDASAAETTDEPDGGARSEFSITLSTTACEQRCPIFDLRLNQKGDVELNGRGNTRQQGWAAKTVPTETAAELLDAIAAANYWELADRYLEEADGCAELEPGLPTYTWGVRTNGPTKIIIDYQGCRGVPEVESLRAIPALLIDKLALASWLGL